MRSTVEKRALELSAFKDIYPPTEKMRAIITPNFPSMGKLTALRFLEWAQQCPDGAMSLPTGKTPEHFIRWVTHLLQNWEHKDVKKIVNEYGLNTKRPDLRGLHFVQIDEFYPVSPEQRNSFAWYVREFYLKGFGLDTRKALLIDCNQIGLNKGEKLEDYWGAAMQVDLSLRHRQPHCALEQKQAGLLSKIDQWCGEYEQKIRALGGLGFFLGGIGPDGHIAFNMRGADHYSTTRLDVTNYETQAASAADLGGVEIAAKRLVITIGLGTMTYNKDCVAIIMAAGEAKSPMVRNAIERDADVLYPASALHKLPNACFYITLGVAKIMKERQLAQLKAKTKMTELDVEKAIIDLSLATEKRILDLTAADVKKSPLATIALKNVNLEKTKAKVVKDLIARIERGINTPANKTFLHTEPHHDDVMLGYLPALARSIRPAHNKHHFVTLTSGFTSVTNHYLKRSIDQLQAYMMPSNSDFASHIKDAGYYNPTNREGRNRDVWAYLDGVAAKDIEMATNGSSRRFMRNLIEVYGEKEVAKLHKRLEKINDYLASVYPGQKDPAEIQKLKGMCREWEAECLWGYFGWNTENVYHSRLGFYSGDIFTPEPEKNRDIPPIVNLLKKTDPDIISLAFDPEGSGPDTHYKVMQAITTALQEYVKTSKKKAVKVWGYRNVWYRFHLAEANIYTPVSLNMFAILENSFLNTFISQKEASFPSYEYDGAFCDLAQKIQVEQYRMLVTCLGHDWFYNHSSPLIRATRGFVFLSEMDLTELCSHSRRLKEAAEMD